MQLSCSMIKVNKTPSNLTRLLKVKTLSFGSFYLPVLKVLHKPYHQNRLIHTMEICIKKKVNRRKIISEFIWMSASSGSIDCCNAVRCPRSNKQAK